MRYSIDFFAFACIECAPYEVFVRFPAGWRMAAAAFLSLQQLAVDRGFTKLQCRQLKGAARRGKATAFAMNLAEAAVALLTPEELRLQIGRTASWLHFYKTGRLEEGWTFRKPDE